MNEFEIIGQLLWVDILWADSPSFLEKSDPTKAYMLVLVSTDGCLKWRLMETTLPVSPQFLDDVSCNLDTETESP